MIISVNKYKIVLIKKWFYKNYDCCFSSTYCLEVSVSQVPASSQVQVQWSNYSHHRRMTAVFQPPKKEEEFHNTSIGKENSSEKELKAEWGGKEEELL